MNTISYESIAQMTRQRRTRVLVDGSPSLAKSLCADIEALCAVRVVSGPREVLVMNKVRESARNSLFFLGEALLTECKVELAAARAAGSGPAAAGCPPLAALTTGGPPLAALTTGCPPLDTLTTGSPPLDAAQLAQPGLGIGLILGSEHERAYELAVIDAAFSLSEPLPATLAAARERWVAKLEAEEARLAAECAKERDRLEATRVEFASMLTEEDREGGANG